MKKFIAMILILAMVMILPVACGTEQTASVDSKENGMNSTYLVWNMGKEPKTFDPGINTGAAGGQIITNIFEGLYYETKSGGLEPAQAESYTVSEDGLTYTFTLRDGIKWSDGKPVTAGDFEYSWKRVCTPETGANYSFIMAPYLKNGMKCLAGECELDDVGVKALNDKTLEVKLEAPCSYFLSLTTFFTYLPVRQDIIENNDEGWDKDVTTCISNGPFVLEEYKIGDKVKIKRNPDYWNSENVKLAGVEALFISEATTALNGYQSGEIQINSQIPKDALANLMATDPNVIMEADLGTYFLDFNCDVEPFNDVKVRKAFALAIDRKMLVDQVTKGGEVAATGMIPPVLSWTDGTCCRKIDAEGNAQMEYGIDPNKAQVEEAKALLAEAGYPDGQGFPTIVYKYSTGEAHQKIGEALQEMWKTNLGVNVTLQNEDWQVFSGSRSRGDYQVARGGWYGDYADPMTFLDLYTSYSGNNDPQWRYSLQKEVAPHDKVLNPENKAFDEVIQKAMLARGQEKDDLYREAEKMIIQDNCIISPLYYYTSIYLVDKTRVVGLDTTKIGQWLFKGAMMIQ